MLVHKGALVTLLQAWWGFFDEKWVTTQEIVDLANDEAKMGRPDWEHGIEVFYRWMMLRGALDNLGRMKIRNGCDLESILDEVKNKIIYGFVIERDDSSLWRVVKQERE
jgi:hypothetical protein